MDKTGIKVSKKRAKRALRVRKKVKDVSFGKPRLSIFRSAKHLYAQIIDDKKGETLVGIGTQSKEMKSAKSPKEVADLLGKKIAELAAEKNVSEVAFDRGRFAFHGRVKAFADAAREAGLKF